MIRIVDQFCDCKCTSRLRTKLRQPCYTICIYVLNIGTIGSRTANIAISIRVISKFDHCGFFSRAGFMVKIFKNLNDYRILCWILIIRYQSSLVNIKVIRPQRPFILRVAAAETGVQIIGFVLHSGPVYSGRKIVGEIAIRNS